jgi:hypothetical protein
VAEASCSVSIVICQGCLDSGKVTEFDPALKDCPVCNRSLAYYCWRNPDGTETPWYPPLDVADVRDPSGNWKRGTWLGFKPTDSRYIDHYTDEEATIAVDFVNAQAQITIGRERDPVQLRCDTHLPTDLLDALQALCATGTRGVSAQVPVLILRWLKREDLIERFRWTAS